MSIAEILAQNDIDTATELEQAQPQIEQKPVTEDKITNLLQRKQDKVNRLNGKYGSNPNQADYWREQRLNELSNMDDSISTINGNVYSNSNKIYNEDSNAHRQKLTSDFVNTGYYWDPENKVYKSVQTNEIIHGKIGGIYHGNMQDGYEKAGYFTVDADSGVDPETQLIQNYKKYEQPGMTGGYEPARDGVNGLLLNNIDTARGFEAYLHGGQQNLNGRKYLLGDKRHYEDKAGRSYTEIVKDGSIWGSDEGNEDVGMTLEDLANIAKSKNKYSSKKPVNVDKDLLLTAIETLKQRESSGNYKADMKPGHSYIGAYQFGAARLQDLGMVKPGTTNEGLNDPNNWTGKYGVKSKEDFLNNNVVQDKVALESIVDYMKKLKPSAKSMDDLMGKVFAAHLLGANGSKNLDNKDGNGTTGNEYYELGKNVYINYLNRPVTVAPEEEGWIDRIGTDIRGFTGSVVRAGGDTVKAANDLLAAGVYGSAKYIWGYDDKTANKIADSTKVLTKERLDRLENYIDGAQFLRNLGSKSEEAEKYQQEAFKGVKATDPSTYGNVNLHALWNMTKAAFASPEMSVKSVGYTIGFVTGVAEKAAAKLAGKGIVELMGKEAAKEVAEKTLKESAKAEAKLAALKASGKTISKSTEQKLNRMILDEEAKKATMKIIDDSTEALMKAPVKDRLKMFLVKNADDLHLGALMTEQDMDEYYDRYGERASVGHVLLSLAGNYAGAKFEITGNKVALLGTKEGLSAFIKSLGKKRATKFVTGMISGGTKLAEGGLAELVVEPIQSAIQGFDSVYKDGNTTEALNRAFHDAIQGAAFGLAGGVHMASPRAVGTASSEAVNGFFDKMSDVANKKKRKKVTSTGKVDTSFTEEVVNSDAPISEKINEVYGSHIAGEVNGEDTSHVAGLKSEVLRQAKEDRFKDEEDAAAFAEAVLYSEAPDIAEDGETLKFKDKEVEEAFNRVLAKYKMAKQKVVDYANKRKTIEDVEKESMFGPNGVYTYETKLDTLMKSKNPDKAAISGLLGNARYFIGTQKKNIEALRNGIARAEKAAREAGSTKPSDVRVTVEHGTQDFNFVIHFDEKNGKYVPQPQVFDVLKRKENIVKELSRIINEKEKVIYDKFGDEAKDIVSTSAKFDGIFIPVSDAPGSKKTNKKRAIERQFIKAHGINKIIHSENNVKWVDYYSNVNSSKSNTGEYSTDDVVLVSPELVKVGKKGKVSEIDKNTIEEAKKALDGGAQLVIDMHATKDGKFYTLTKLQALDIAKRIISYYNKMEKIDNESAQKFVVKELRNSKGKTTGRYIIVPVEKATEMERVVKEKKAAKSKKSKALKDLAKYYDKNGVMPSIDDEVYKNAEPYFPDTSKDGGKTSLEKMEIYAKNVVKKLAEKEEAKELERLRRKEEGLVAEEEKEGTTVSEKEGKKKAKEKFDANKKAKEILDRYRALQKELTEALDDRKKGKSNKRSVDEIKVDIEELEGKLSTFGDSTEEVLANSISKDAGDKFVNKTQKKDGSYKYSVVDEVAEKFDGMYKKIIQDVNKVVEFVKKKGSLIASIPYRFFGRKVVKRVRNFKEALEKTIPLYVGDKEAFEFIDSPGRGILISVKNGKRVYNDNVVTAMALAVDSIVAYNAYLLDGGFKSDKDLARMFHIDEKDVTPALRRLLKDRGMMHGSLARELGGVIVQNLGLVSKKDSESREHFEKIAADLGNMAIHVAMQEGLLADGGKVTAGKLTAALNNDEDVLVDEEGSIRFVKLGKYEGSFEDYSNGLLEWAKEFNKVTASDMDNFRGYRIKPRKTEKTEYVKGDAAKTKVDPEKREALKKLRETEWKLDATAAKWVLDEKNIDAVKKSLGYIEPTSDKYAELSKESREAADGKNRAIDRSIKFLADAYEDLKDGKVVYFDYDIVSNGRFQLNSNTVNPQMDLLHRWLFYPATHTTAFDLSRDGSGITLKYKGEDYTNISMYAIAQAFGFKVDGKNTEDVLKMGRLLFKLGSDRLEEMMANGKLVVNDKELEIESMGHAIRAVDAIRAIEKAANDGDKKVTLNITAEFDSKTSGFALKLLQMPIINGVTDWLRRVGIFIGEDADRYKNAADLFANEDFTDSYEFLAKAMSNINTEKAGKDFKKSLFQSKKHKLSYDKKVADIILDKLPKVDSNGVVNSELRSLFKTPFMIFNYSAGMKSIRRSLSRNIATQIIDKIAAGDKTYEDLANKIVANTDYKNIDDLATAIKRDGYSDIMISTGSDYGIDLLDWVAMYVDALYGAKVEEIMTNNFKEFVDAHRVINNAFKMMFAVFNVEYKKKIEAIIAEKGYITDNDKFGVLEELRGLFPMIKSPTSKGADDGVAIYTTKRGVPAEELSTTNVAQTWIKDKDGKLITSKARHELKMFEAAVSSGSVLPIHYIDAAIMTRVINSLGGDIVSIHDAVIPSLVTAMRTTTEYNKRLYEIAEEYSLINELNNAFKRVAEKANEMLEPVIIEVYDPTLKEMVNYDVDAIQESIQKLQQDVEAGRERLHTEVKKRGARVMNMVTFPGGDYRINREGSSTEKDIVEEKPARFTVRDIAKENAKQKEDIIKEVKDSFRKYLGKDGVLPKVVSNAIKEELRKLYDEKKASGDSASTYVTRLEALLEACK